MRSWSPVTSSVLPALLAVLTALATGCAAGWSDDDRPAMGDVLIQFHEVGARPALKNTTSLRDDRLAVTINRRAATLRQGERVELTLPASEVRQLRRELAGDLADHDGTIDRTGGWTDQPFAVISTVDLEGDLHHVRYEGKDRDAWFDSAAGRLRRLADKVRRDGTVDQEAPVQVSLRSATDEVGGPAIRWPAAITPPALTAGSVAYQTYAETEAARLRKVLGAAERDVLVRLPDGRSYAARWAALLPGN